MSYIPRYFFDLLEAAEQQPRPTEDLQIAIKECQYRLKKNGETVPKKFRRPLPKLDLEWVYEQVCEHERPLYRVAKEVGVHRLTLSRRLADFIDERARLAQLAAPSEFQSGAMQLTSE